MIAAARSFVYFSAGFVMGGVALYFYTGMQDDSLPKLSSDTSVVSEEEYNATKIPCRSLVYERFGEKTRDVTSTTSWRRDGYVVVEMSIETEDRRNEFRLCVVDPSNPAKAALMEEKDRPHWFEQDSEESFY